MRHEVDTASPRYRAGWHDGLGQHVPRSEDQDYLAGWNEGARLRLGDNYARIISSLKRRATDVEPNAK